LQAVPVLILSSIVCFGLLRLLPGDTAVAVAGPRATTELVNALRQTMGLDQPLPVQYVIWIAHLLQGDLGRSAFSDQPIIELFQARIPASLELILAGMALEVVIALTTGIWAAVKLNTKADWIISSYNGLMMSIPNFWLGILAILLFALVLGWLPPGGRVADGNQLALSAKSLVLPALALGLGASATLSRFVKASMLEVLLEDYVRTAWAKGLRSRAVIIQHALRNALLPVVTILGLQFSRLLGGAIIIEAVFSWPGLGGLLLDSIGNRDYAIVQAGLLFLVFVNIVVNLLTDLTYGLLDPRIRLSGG
jgi:peptide/nickel transport system permease protein